MSLPAIAWTGENHLAVFGKIKNLAEQWSPQHIVIDATGVGEGLWSLLDRSFPTRVIPVKFTAQEKSEIGWRFLSIIETGRFSDPAPYDDANRSASSTAIASARSFPVPLKPSVGVSPMALVDPMAPSSTMTISSPIPSPPSSTAWIGLSVQPPSSFQAPTRWME